MGKLSGIVDMLLVNDYASLYAFENLVANRGINLGVSWNSTEYRNENITSNYENGSVFRAKSGENFGYYYNSENNRLEKPSITSENIGENASIDSYGNNSKLKFLTTNDFLEFNELIRKTNIDNKKVRITSDTDYSKSENGVGLEKYMDNFDESFSVDVAFDNAEYGNLYYKNDDNPKEPNNNGSLKKIGKIIRDSLVSNENMNGMKFYTNIAELYEIFGTNDLREVEYFKKTKIPNIDYSDYGTLQFSSLVDSQLKFSANLGFGTKNNPYAVDSVADLLFNSDIRKKKEYKDTKITKNNGGNLSTSNGTNRAYTYYEENDDGNVVTAINESNTSSDSIVGISNFDGASNLLKKTNELFRDKKIKSLVNRFKTGGLDTINKELETSFTQYGLSRGRNLLSKGSDSRSGFSNPYCRVWTAAHQYSKLKHRIRPFYDSDEGLISIGNLQSSFGELRPNNGAERLENNSVLKNDGFVRISPEHGEDGSLKKENIQKYMFSIENLAWRDVINTAGLSEEQRGPNNGRIMWFPPYNLKFTENVNVEWNANKFIGRGEQIYTYTNTDRSGTLSFTLLIDHPSILNKWRTTSANVEKDPYENDLLRFFAGCSPLYGNVTGSQDNKSSDIETVPTSNPIQGKQPTTYAYVLFFPNNYTGQNDGADDALRVLQRYETVSSDIVNNVDKDFADRTGFSANTSEYSLNMNISQDIEEKIKKTLLSNENDEHLKIIPMFNSVSGCGALSELITNDKIFGVDAGKCKVEKVRVKGFASSHGYQDINEKLASRRANMITLFLKMNCFDLSNELYSYDGTDIIDVGQSTSNESINTLNAKIARSAVALIDVTWDDKVMPMNRVDYSEEGSEEITTAFDMEFEDDTTVDKEPEEKRIAVSETVVDDPIYKYDNEYLYFSEVRGDELVYKSILDKVRYFSPAFHSITPEGFNARLTFLQQCTRQGPTMSVSSGLANKTSDDYLKFAGNLSFGRPPYCVLRIGDFFHTKICITSLSIDYDNGGGLQWDLNPEGVGVQPMFANVNINFNFIGGQDIAGPVERLQNAVSYNYYANASIYDSKADFGGRTAEGEQPKEYYNPFGTNRESDITEDNVNQ